MKNKFLLIPALFLFSSSLSSCNKSNQKIEIKRDESLTAAVELTKDEFITKVENEDSFIFYVSSSSCSSCQRFKEVINKYILDTHAILYSINTKEADYCSKYFTYKITPTLFVFSEGKQVAKTDYDSGNLNTIETFKKYIDKYSYLSPVLRITMEKLDEMINEKKSFVIKYTWDKCGDCKAADRLFKDFFQKNHEKYLIYEVELSEFYDNREDRNDPYWTDMTKKYGLSAEGSEEFGWSTGVVPTYQYRKEGEIKSSAIIYNEEYESVEDDLKVVNSFYKDCPHLNKIFKASSTKSSYQIYQEKTSDFFLNKLDQLLKLSIL